MADSVNHLLVVGFYLVNLGFILLYLRHGTKPTDIENGVEYAATKLGAMHFFNMYNFDRMRKKGREHNGDVPPLLKK